MENVKAVNVKVLFEKQVGNRWRLSQSSAEERTARLSKLRDAILAKRVELQTAIYDDFRKHPTETDLTEIFPTISELNHTINHLKDWMEPHSVGTPLALFGTSSEIRYEARGLVLVLAPWNYPFGLSVNPVVAAIAAGNCVIMKPSSKVPKTARFLRDLFSGLFDEGEVAIIEGDHSISDALLALPFDHVFFTGSPNIGKHVMTQASKHLATVTLELGGKSPVIVDETANIKKAAERIMWAKFINAGQTCVAPDYLFIHESRCDAFISEAKRILSKRFGSSDAEREKNQNFCRLVTETHLRSLLNILNEALFMGAKIEVGGQSDLSGRYLAPTILSNVRDDSPIMRDEIFGPILPIITFNSLSDACASIRSREKPLALYIFSQNKTNIDLILKNTTAGGTCINSLIIHLANNNLPFGGVGKSGMGNYHGWFGFKQLSHERAVLRQGRLDILRFFYPPYTRFVKKLADLLIKFFS